jgi:hypothetical protein
MDERTTHCGIEDEPAREAEFDYPLAQAAAKQAQAIKANMFPAKFVPAPEHNFDFALAPKPPSSDCGV